MLKADLRAATEVPPPSARYTQGAEATCAQKGPMGCDASCSCNDDLMRVMREMIAEFIE